MEAWGVGLTWLDCKKQVQIYSLICPNKLSSHIVKVEIGSLTRSLAQSVSSLADKVDRELGKSFIYLLLLMDQLKFFLFIF